LTPSIFIAQEPHTPSARPPERQGRVDLVVDLDQRIEDHRPAVIAIDVEGVHRRIGVFRRVPAIDPEALDVRGRLGERPMLAFPDLRICRERKLSH
jgi:hypothetical protein